MTATTHLPNVVDDLVTAHALDLDADDRLWVPQGEGVAFRPLIFSVSQGYFVNILRVRRAGVVSRHRHAGPVHAFTLRGRWHYPEHDWWAEAGTYSFEPPGDIHTLVVPDGDGADVEMAALFHVTGAYVYVDEHGAPVAIEDVFSKLARTKEHYRRVGLEDEVVDRLIR